MSTKAAKTSISSKKLNAYEKALREKKVRILGDVAQLEQENLGNSQRDATGDLSGYGIHMADAGSEAAERELMLDLASSEQKAVERINHALERIDAGTYGTCELCGKDISEPRLEALPESTVCIKCMKKYDL